jgi:hypothetical protein
MSCNILLLWASLPSMSRQISKSWVEKIMSEAFMWQALLHAPVLMSEGKVELGVEVAECLVVVHNQGCQCGRSLLL